MWSNRQFHYNKDWNFTSAVPNSKPLRSLIDNSITTRIETTNDCPCATSWCKSNRQFHYNKDWNKKTVNGNAKWIRSNRQFHYNKDWNNLSNSFSRQIKTSNRQFHYNKDWNKLWLNHQVQNLDCLIDNSITTRIETQLNLQY